MCNIYMSTAFEGLSGMEGFYLLKIFKFEMKEINTQHITTPRNPMQKKAKTI